MTLSLSLSATTEQNIPIGIGKVAKISERVANLGKIRNEWKISVSPRSCSCSVVNEYSRNTHLAKNMRNGDVESVKIMEPHIDILTGLDALYRSKFY